MLAYGHPPFVLNPPSRCGYEAEWAESCVHPDIVALNVMPVDGQTALELLSEDAIAGMQRDYAYLSREAARLIERYAPIVEGGGGWWVSGLDPLNHWQRMTWGQLKPNTPRAKLDEVGQPVSGKWIKYESPARVPTRAIFLELSQTVAELVYRTLNQQFGCLMPRLLELCI
jgi:hypothetical protein